MLSDNKLLRKVYTYLRYGAGKELKQTFSKFSNEQYNTVNGEIKYRKILFCPFTPHRLNIVRESIIAHACRIRGAEVKMLSYDLFLDAIDFMGRKDKKDPGAIYVINRKVYNIVKLPVVFMSEYYDKDKKYDYDFDKLTVSEIENLTYNGIYLGDLVIASTVRYFLSNEPEWENPEFIDRARKFARTAVILTDVYENLLSEEKPDKIVASHGIYVSWGTLFRVARSKNIAIDIYGSSYRRNTLRFYHNSPNAPFPEALWPKYKDIPLSQEQEETVDKYFRSRETQKDDGISLFDENTNFPDSLRQFILKAQNDNKVIFGLFTNIAWDAFMFNSGSAVFDSMIDWLNSTISYFEENKDSALIIKAHPAEIYHNVPEQYYIRNILPKNLPDNIYFIDNNENVKPFDLYPYIDIGLTYLSTVTIEMALMGKTVITAGDISQYSGKGFTIDPSSREEYFEILDRAAKRKLNFIPDVEMAKRYMFYRFFREALVFDYLELKKYQIKKIKLDSPEDLMPGKDQHLDIICEGILNDGDFIVNNF